MSKAKLGSTARLVSTATVGSTATLEFKATLGSRKVHAYLSVVRLLIYTKHLTNYHCLIVKCISVPHTRLN